ncbi:hypothetical protein AVEN_141232-1 [Araneus ventricosus]|uniref:Uncharacterized protein n=1 Tax=Araneus ventricosus TaxID=182803 RepID=A0A4Y1ZXP7_ARAVE|nr:hypothetical protein AVEN_141232-1 [Araneus ventricosus]
MSVDILISHSHKVCTQAIRRLRAKFYQSTKIGIIIMGYSCRTIPPPYHAVSPSSPTLETPEMQCDSEFSRPQQLLKPPVGESSFHTSPQHTLGLGPKTTMSGEAETPSARSHKRTISAPRSLKYCE